MSGAQEIDAVHLACDAFDAKLKELGELRGVEFTREQMRLAMSDAIAAHIKALKDQGYAIVRCEF